MFNYTLFKIILSMLGVIIIVVVINFIGNTLMASEQLDKDVVSISSEVMPTVAKASISKTTTEVEDGISEITPEKSELSNPIIALLASADIAKGARISKSCAACHSFNKGGKNKQGPNLWGIVGKGKADKDGFSYSDAMKSVGGIWDYDSLNSFLTKPKKYIKGTKMNFAGLRKDKDRAALIIWLREQSDAPFALPIIENPAAD